MFSPKPDAKAPDPAQLRRPLYDFWVLNWRAGQYDWIKKRRNCREKELVTPVTLCVICHQQHMKVLNLQNRTLALIENGSWACKSGDLMQKFIDHELKNMTVLNERLSFASTLKADKAFELGILASMH